MTQLTNPECDHGMYFMGQFQFDPPALTYDWGVGNCHYKWLEAEALLRMATGTTEGQDIQRVWKESVAQRIGADGLHYWPTKDQPIDSQSPGHSFYPFIGESDTHGLAQPTFHGRLIAALALWAIEDNEPIWIDRAKTMIDRLSEIALRREGMAHIPMIAFAPGANLPENFEWQTEIAATCQAWLVQGLCQFYRHHPYEPALKLAKELMAYVVSPEAHIFEEDGFFGYFNHFHHHSQCILSALDLYRITREDSLMDFAQQAYAWGKRYGNETLGFFPEGTHDREGNYNYSFGSLQSAETCEIADMISAAIKLAKLGHDACWDDADKWVRNQFAENQMLDMSWAQPMVDANQFPPPADEVYISTDRVIERHIGSFAGWPLPNDVWFEDLNSMKDKLHGHGCFMHCCTGNGSRALYYVWDAILTADESAHTLRINLPLNRISQWADVHSHIPYQGRVDVRMKQDMCVSLRMPAWVNLSGVTATVDGQGIAVQWEGRYLQAGNLKAGQTLTVQCPLTEQTQTLSIGSTDYTVVLRGHDVVCIDPPGKWKPYYQREHYRNNETRFTSCEFTPTLNTPTDW